MAPFLKKIPVITLCALSVCLTLAACGHDPARPGAAGGGVYVGAGVGR